MQKNAIFKEQDQLAFLAECGDLEFVPCWLMLRCGMHTHDIVYRDNLYFDGQWLQYKRCKTGRPRKFLIPPDVVPRLVKWLERGRRLTPDGYHKMVRRVGERAGLGTSITPMSLRHTFGLQELRRYRRRADAIDLVAASMGCTRAVVVRYYIELQQWESMEEGMR